MEGRLILIFAIFLGSDNINQCYAQEIPGISIFETSINFKGGGSWPPEGNTEIECNPSPSCSNDNDNDINGRYCGAAVTYSTAVYHASVAGCVIPNAFNVRHLDATLCMLQRVKRKSGEDPPRVWVSLGDDKRGLLGVCGSASLHPTDQTLDVDTMTSCDSQNSTAMICAGEYYRNLTSIESF